MADEPDYDLVVIGSGPGGYVASVRAAELGMRVACVEREERLGGVCLRVGCIPSKALLDSSEHFHRAAALGDHGVRVPGVELDLAAMMARKERVVETLTGGVRALLERHRVDIVRGVARLVGPQAVRVQPPGGTATELTARWILLATGSEPAPLPGIPADGTRIVTSTEALGFTGVPAHLVVVGGGYIGLELGSVWARLGAKVTVVETLPRIASGIDGQVARYLERALRQQGLEVRTKARVAAARVEGDGVRVEVSREGGLENETLSCDRLLVAVGRRPATGGLGLEEIGVGVEPGSGRVPVDAEYRTSVPTVYAIGDLVQGPMLAHKASAEGIAAVEGMAGLPCEVNYDTVPSVVYTEPEVAAVGKTEEELKAAGVAYVAASYPFSAVGRAVCMGEPEGFTKVLAHRRSDRILGVHIVGPRASDLLAEAVVAMEFGASSEDLARTVHAHPTLSEGLWEAARRTQSAAAKVPAGTERTAAAD